MKSIRSKLIIVMLLIVIIPFTILNVSNSYLINSGYRKTIERSHLDIANTLSENIKTFMDSYYILTEEIVNNKDIIGFDPEKQKEVLEGTGERHPEVDLFYVQGLDGMQTARSVGVVGDRSERWWFKKMMEVQETFVSESYFSLNGNVVVTSVFMPVRNKNDEFIGVMGTDLKLDNLQDLVERLSTEGGTTAYVIDNKGVVIAHPNKEQVVEQYNYLEMTKHAMKTDDNGDVVLDDVGNHVLVTETIEVPIELQEAVRKGLNGEKGFVEYKEGNKGKFSAYTSIEIPGNSENWAVITVEDKSSALNFVSNINRNNMVVTIGLLLLITAISVYLSKRVTEPLDNIKEALYKASMGDLNSILNFEGEDEFIAVGDSFNKMVSNLNNLIANIRNVGDTVTQSSGALADITHQTTIANEGIAKAVEEIANGTVELVDEIVLGEKEIEELTKRIELVGESLSNMGKVTTKTDQLNTAGLVVVRELQQKSNDNIKASNQLNEIMREMDSSALEIGTITNTISKISEQTNLLALNAAIEAARVGEEGKGFAVVAEEIRKLAEESNESASHINILIDKIQEKSRGAVEAVRETNEIAEGQNKQVNATEGLLNNIGKALTDLNNEAEKISKAVEDMIARKDGVTDMIKNISELSQDTSGSTEELSASIEEQLATTSEISRHASNLDELSNDIMKTINKFESKTS